MKQTIVRSQLILREDGEINNIEQGAKIIKVSTPRRDQHSVTGIYKKDWKTAHTPNVCLRLKKSKRPKERSQIIIIKKIRAA